MELTDLRDQWGLLVQKVHKDKPAPMARRVPQEQLELKDPRELMEPLELMEQP